MVKIEQAGASWNRCGHGDIRERAGDSEEEPERGSGRECEAVSDERALFPSSHVSVKRSVCISERGLAGPTEPRPRFLPCSRCCWHDL